MRFLSQIKSLISSTEPLGERRIAVFGDSHTAALISAKDFPDRKHHYDQIRIYRLLKQKSGKIIGDSTLENFCSEIRSLGSGDCVFSAVGGNQYAIVSTVRTPVEYDFLTPSEHRDAIVEGAALVPFRALAGYIQKGLRGTMRPVLRQIREATSARVFHVAPPPPKEDNGFIAKNFESRFAGEGIEDYGPTHPSLRLKCWQVQLECLAELCEELGIGLVRPPKEGVTATGFLAPRCYASDVTHANRRYGEFVLRQMLEIAGGEGGGKG
jgi:hypothetical protein